MNHRQDVECDIVVRDNLKPLAMPRSLMAARPSTDIVDGAA
jgi:hypothetical protein